MKLKTLNASRSVLIRAYTSLHADPVFVRVFPAQKRGAILYNFKSLNHFQPWGIPSISSRKLIPSSPDSLSSAFFAPHSLAVSSRFAGDIKIIYKTVCVSCDFVASQKQNPRLAVHCCNYFSHHCFHFSLPLSPPAEPWLVLMGNTLWDLDRYFKDTWLLLPLCCM